MISAQGTAGFYMRFEIRAVTLRQETDPLVGEPESSTLLILKFIIGHDLD
jgi:hypothetical protein